MRLLRRENTPARKDQKMSETPQDADRRHTQEPAEGDPEMPASGVRAHTQEPAEGGREKAPDEDE
jgi:hypothetical protein